MPEQPIAATVVVTEQTGLETLQTQIRFEGLRQGLPTGARLIQLFGLPRDATNQGSKCRCEEAEIRGRSSLLPLVNPRPWPWPRRRRALDRGMLLLQVPFQQIQTAASLRASPAEFHATLRPAVPQGPQSSDEHELVASSVSCSPARTPRQKACGCSGPNTGCSDRAKELGVSQMGAQLPLPLRQKPSRPLFHHPNDTWSGIEAAMQAMVKRFRRSGAMRH